jgi:hypothetical protein
VPRMGFSLATIRLHSKTPARTKILCWSEEPLDKVVDGGPVFLPTGRFSVPRELCFVPAFIGDERLVYFVRL